MGSIEKALSPFIKDYRVLTSFREPLSHFFSAAIHNAMRVEQNGYIYNFSEAVEALKNGKNLPYHYPLHNFQTSFLRRNYSPFADAHDVYLDARKSLKDIYWFSIADHMDMSLALLQCQAIGRIEPKLLDIVVNLRRYNDHTRSNVSFSVNAAILRDVRSLIQTDVLLYEEIMHEFRSRINYHRQCLANSSLDLSYWI